MGTRNGLAISYEWGLALTNWLLPPVLGLLIFGLATEGTVLSAPLGTSFARFLGRPSYALYLLRQRPFDKWIERYTSNVWLTFLIVLIASALAYRFFEKPMNLLIRNGFRFRRRTPSLRLEGAGRIEKALERWGPSRYQG